MLPQPCTTLLPAAGCITLAPAVGCSTNPEEGGRDVGVKDGVVQVRVTGALLARLDAVARAQGVGRSQAAREAVECWVGAVEAQAPVPTVWAARVWGEGKGEVQRTFPTREKRQAFLDSLVRFGKQVRVLALDPPE